MIIQAGIKRVLAPAQPDNQRWDENAVVALEMLNEAGIPIVYYKQHSDGTYDIDETTNFKEM